jgi:hypothetical protein
VRLDSSFLTADNHVFSFVLAPSFPLHHLPCASLLNPGPRRPSLLASSHLCLAHVHRTFSPLLTASPWRLRLKPAPSHLCATRTAVPSALSCSFPLFSFPLLFGVSSLACTTPTPSLHRPSPPHSTTTNATSSSGTTTRDQRSTTGRASRRCAPSTPRSPDAAVRGLRRAVCPQAPLHQVHSRRLRTTHRRGSGQLFRG